MYNNHSWNKYMPYYKQKSVTNVNANFIISAYCLAKLDLSRRSIYVLYTYWVLINNQQSPTSEAVTKNRLASRVVDV